MLKFYLVCAKPNDTLYTTISKNPPYKFFNSWACDGLTLGGWKIMGKLDIPINYETGYAILNFNHIE